MLFPPCYRNPQTSSSDNARQQRESSDVPTVEDMDENGCPSATEEGMGEPKAKKLKMDATGRRYEYKKIGTLQPGDKKVNVFGVVVDFKEPFQTRGRDFCSFVSLVDDTSPTSGIKCTIFNQSREKLPQVKQVGDIVCVHRVNVHKRDETLFLEGAAFTSAMCFDGKLGAAGSPRTGSISYTCGTVEKEAVRQLRVWALRRERAAFGRQLESVVPNCYFDLACQVVAVTDCRPACDAVILTVWDGTRFPLKARQVDFSYLKSSVSPQLLHVAGGLAEHVVIYKRASLETAKELRLGEIVQLQNLHSSIQQTSTTVSSDSIVELCLSVNNPGSVVVLPNHSPEYLDLRAEIGKASGDKALLTSRLPDSTPGEVGTTTTTRHSDVRFVSLASIRSCTKVPLKFRARVKVLGISPSIVEEFVRRSCTSCGCLSCISPDSEEDSCLECNTSSWEYVFAFKLLLEDCSGKLTAYASDADAIKILGGLQPTNLHSDLDVRYQVLERLYFLTGGNDPFPSNISALLPRPWMDCCLLSYLHSSQEGEASHVCYRIFDTTLNCDDL